MHGLGLPVPEGFVITTEACVFYIKTGEMPEGLMDEVKENLQRVEEATGWGFGDAENPLLVSVRSGAPVSMPGMMDTVLNRPERRYRPRPGAEHERRTLRPGLAPALHPGVLRDRAEDAGASLRGRYRGYEGRAGCRGGHGAYGRGSRRARWPVQGDRVSRGGCGGPGEPLRAAGAGGRGGLRLVARKAGRGVPPGVRHPGYFRDSRYRTADGLREHGGDSGDRGGVHPQPGDGGSATLWRVPVERPGRGRGRGHPHATPALGDGGGAAGDLPAVPGPTPRTLRRRSPSERGAERTPKSNGGSYGLRRAWRSGTRCLGCGGAGLASSSPRST